MTIDVGVVASAGSLHALGFKSDHGSVTVTKRERGAACHLAPWLLEVEIEGQQRYSFWPDEEAAIAAALEVLGLLAEAAAAEERAAEALAAACAVLVADVFSNVFSSNLNRSR